MPDRGKTIEDLKQLAKDDWILHFNDTDVKETAKAALALLKEQEPVKPIRLANWWKCPSCSGNIVANMQYCPRCGRPVKWDADN